MSKERDSSSRRIVVLDYLRGFFIVVIIIDHLWKFPSVWSLMTGEAKLWMTAAEGFVIISGFLIGYIRGNKGLHQPFKTIAKKLVMRGTILYVWMIIATLGYAAIRWYATLIPNVPSPPQAIYDWAALIQDTLTMRTPSLWIFFLAYYAIFLFLAVPFIWLLRHRYWPLALSSSLLLYLLGTMTNEGWMKWQIVFFIPAMVGFYYPALIAWWSRRKKKQRQLYRRSIMSASGMLLAVSVICTFIPSVHASPVAEYLNNLFNHDSFGPFRVIFSFVGFVGIGFVFDSLLPWLETKWGGLLYYFGNHSLTAYICHGLVICLVNLLISLGDLPQGFAANTLYGALGVLMVYWLIRTPIVARIVPR